MPRACASVLLLVVACAPSPEPPALPPAARAGEGARPPVRKDSEEVTARAEVRPGPLRLLHPRVYTYAPLEGGALLLEPRPRWVERGGEVVAEDEGSPQRLDVASGARTPWAQDWELAGSGWRLRRGGVLGSTTPEVSADGRRVAVGYSFEPRPGPRERVDLVAIVVSRADGSEARCVGVGVPSDDPPPFLWSFDGRRLVGDWSIACEPDRRGRPRAIGDAPADAWPRPMRWLDLVDGRGGELPFRWNFEVRDPLGDLVASEETGVGLEIFDLASGRRVAEVAGEPGSARALGWVGPDAVLVEVREDGGAPRQRVVFTDGGAVELPGPPWQIFTRAPGGWVLFSRDGGGSVEQARVDWRTLRVEERRARPELAPFATPRDPGQLAAEWRPGLGGVLIHEPDEGALYLAGL